MTTGRALGIFLIVGLTGCMSIGDPQTEGGGDCAPSEYACASGSCVPREQVCNGVANCDDGADEENCVQRCERRSDYRCKDGVTCVSADAICDGRDDCPGADDEATCASTSCAGFQCRDGSCIEADQKCDGNADCLLAEDEAPGLCSPTRCGDEDLRCGDGKTCVRGSKICDGNPDCPGSEDEEPSMCAARENGGGGSPKTPDRPGTDPKKPTENKPDKGRPCNGIDELGLCDGNVLVWCDGGQVERRDCGADDNKVCIKVSDTDGHACIPGANTPPEPDNCGDVSVAGRCEGDVIVFCARGEVRRQDCNLRRPAMSCSEEGTRAHCEARVAQGEPDACQGIPEGGMCDGDNILVHCKDGQPQRYDCSAGGMKCEGDTGNSSCVAKQSCTGAASDGSDLEYYGECAGGTLRYCYEDSVTEFSCADFGLTCGLWTEELGYSCVPESGGGECGDVSFEGTCDGNTVSWCENETLWSFDCGTSVCGDVALSDGSTVKGCQAPPPAPSCQKPDGTNFCGSYDAVPGSGDPGCHCDEFCDAIGDCCDDYTAICELATP